MTPRTKLSLSVVLITLNAERTLMQTLLSVLSLSDDIVVVDSGSTDGTVQTAKMLGCRVIHRPFDGYGPQKQFAVQQAVNDWVLLLDADEVPDTTMLQAIRQVMESSPKPQQAYSLPRSLVFMNRVMKHSGENRRPVVRLFNRQFGGVTGDAVHEWVYFNGKSIALDGTLLHYSYASLSDYLDKMNRYTTAGAAKEQEKAGQTLERRGLHFDSLKMFGRFTTRFLKIYVLKMGFLDGLPGMVWALLSAMYPVIKHTKRFEQINFDNPNFPSARPVEWSIS